MAVHAVPWSPQQHTRFPPAFQVASRELLLAAHRWRQPAYYPPGFAEGQGRQRRISAKRAAQLQEANMAGAGLAALPDDLLLRIVAHAAYPLSAWGDS